MSAEARKPIQQGSPEPSQLSDLLEAVAHARDRAAFCTLFDHFAPRLKGYVMGMGIAAHIAEEVAQDVMLTAWHKAHTFDRRRANATTWLYTIARNRRIDLARRAMREVLDPNEPSLHAAPPAQPDTQVAQSQRDKALHAAIAALPQEQADIVRLAFTRGWSHGEISRNTGIPLGTVKSRIRLALSRLRKSVGPDAEL